MLSASGVATPTFRLVAPAGSATPLSGPGPYGLSPVQIRHAYGFDQTFLPGSTIIGDGSGQTIAIIDAYDDPNILADLQAFDTQFGLLAPPSFVKMSQTGSTTSFPSVDPNGPSMSGSWELEIALDVEWAHALAPGANILLVECNSSSFADLTKGVDTARQRPGVSVISMSFGSLESGFGSASSETANDSFFVTPTGHGGITFIAATGDSGHPGTYPATAPSVLAVGGTTLTVDTAGNVQSETGWSGSGGGVSTAESQPAYQHGIVTQSTTNRAIPDVAFDADPNTGASVFDSYDFGDTNPWVRVGGTSFSSPAWGALIAIADQSRATAGLDSLDGASQTLPKLYAMPSSDFNDILTGNNGFSAGPGYDLVTGLGSPHVAAVVNDLVGPFSLAISSPANGSVVANVPTDFAIAFSSPYATTGLLASDLTVNGIEADSFALTSSTTISFHFNASPVTAQGLQTVTVAAGAIQRQVDGSPLVAYNGSFHYDTLVLAVDQSSPADAAIVNLPLTSIALHFNEVYATASISVSNLTLSQGTVTGFELVDSHTVRYTLSGITSAGLLNVAIAAGAITDVYGNACAAFSETLLGNSAATAFPALIQSSPAGSLIYQNSVAGSLLFSGNTYSYTLSLAAGQSLSLVAQSVPVLQARLDLSGPGVNVSSTASASGLSAVLSSTPIALSGVYTVTVSGAASTTGNFVLRAMLNAAPSGSLVGAGNHTPATAQSLDAAFDVVHDSSQRAAVVSTPAIAALPNVFGYGAVQVPYQFDDIVTTGTNVSFGQTTGFGTPLTPTAGNLALAFPFYGTTYSRLNVGSNGIITFGNFGSNSSTNSDLSASPNQAVIAPLWDNLTIGGSANSAAYYKLESSGRLVVEWYQVSFTSGPQTGQVTFEAILNPDGTIIFNYQNYNVSRLRAGDAGPTVGIKNSRTAGADPLLVSNVAATSPLIVGGSSIEIGRNLITATNDFYAFSLSAGQSATLAVKSQNGAAVHVALEDGTGTVIASGISPGAGANVNELLSSYVATSPGTYYAVVTGGANAAYDLIVNRDAAFSVSTNHASATAQDIRGAKGVLGDILPSTTDWYSLNLSAGDGLFLQAYTPGGAIFQPVNNLAPQIELYDPGGTLIATGEGGRSQSLGVSILASGIYRIHVLGGNSTTGEYFLGTRVNAAPAVAGVYVSGGGDWSSSFYNYLATSGLGDPQLGYQLLGGNAQLKPIPWTNVTTISVLFTLPVNLDTSQAGLALIGSPDLPDAPALSGATFSYSSVTHVAQWIFSSPLPDDKYLLAIPSAAVASTLGVALDGEFTNAATGAAGGSFPSGDETAGGDFGFRFNLLPGNATQSGTVTGIDGNGVRMHLLQSTADLAYSPFYDLDGSGAITGVDGALVRVRLLQSLPATDPSPPPAGPHALVAAVPSVISGGSSGGVPIVPSASVAPQPSTNASTASVNAAGQASAPIAAIVVRQIVVGPRRTTLASIILPAAIAPVTSSLVTIATPVDRSPGLKPIVVQSLGIDKPPGALHAPTVALTHYVETIVAAMPLSGAIRAKSVSLTAPTPHTGRLRSSVTRVLAAKAARDSIFEHLVSARFQ